MERDAAKALEGKNERISVDDKACEIEPQINAGGAKVWSLTGDDDAAKGSSFKVFKFPAKSKVCISRCSSLSFTVMH